MYQLRIGVVGSMYVAWHQVRSMEDIVLVKSPSWYTKRVCVVGWRRGKSHSFFCMGAKYWTKKQGREVEEMESENI